MTGRCIVKLDHYCPWTNNAIGVRNHKFFLLFIWYTFVFRKEDPRTSFTRACFFLKI